MTYLVEVAFPADPREICDRIFPPVLLDKVSQSLLDNGLFRRQSRGGHCRVEQGVIDIDIRPHDRTPYVIIIKDTHPRHGGSSSATMPSA
jgi:hypothetical protein